MYAQCSATFEEVALKFLDKDERDPLRAYLISRLERTRKTVCSPAHALDAMCTYLSLLGSHTADDACDLARRVLPQQVQPVG